VTGEPGLDAAALVSAAADAGLGADPSDPVVLHVEPALAVRGDTASGRRGPKAQRPGTDAAVLGRQLELARQASPFVTPLTEQPTVLKRRLVTVWPAGEPIDPDRLETVPWVAAAELLADVHRLPAVSVPDPASEFTSDPLPPHGAPARVRRVLRRLAEVDEPRLAPARRVVASAAAGLAPVSTIADVRVCHGDFHLGQVVRLEQRWQLIDVDDVGIGDTRWDFAWPASWFAVGLIAPEAWATFIDSYRAVGGTAVGAAGDPWPLLDGVARAATVHIAARSILRAGEEQRDLDDLDRAFVDAVTRFD